MLAGGILDDAESHYAGGRCFVGPVRRRQPFGDI